MSIADKSKKIGRFPELDFSRSELSFSLFFNRCPFFPGKVLADLSFSPANRFLLGQVGESKRQGQGHAAPPSIISRMQAFI